MNSDLEVYPNDAIFTHNSDHADNKADPGLAELKIEDHQVCSENVSLQHPINHENISDLPSVNKQLEVKLSTHQALPNIYISHSNHPEEEDIKTQPLNGKVYLEENDCVLFRHELGANGDMEKTTVKQEDYVNCFVAGSPRYSSFKCEPTWDVSNLEESRSFENTDSHSSEAGSLSCSVSRKESFSVSDVCSVNDTPLPESPEPKFLTQELKPLTPKDPGSKPFACQYCNAKFAQASGKKYHERIHTGEKPFACQYCDAKFIRPSNLKYHEMKHTGTQPHKCQYCDAKFVRSFDMKCHERIHTGEKPFACRYCDAKFARSLYLKIHEKVHTLEKPHKCQYSDATFARSLNLKSHVRIHTGEKPYHCKLCNTSFRFNTSFSLHKRMHTGERPHKCQYCDAKFARSIDMKCHERIHTGEKPFACRYCDAKFSQSCNRGVHERIHTRGKSSECKQGNFTVFQEKQLTNCDDDVHSIENYSVCSDTDASKSGLKSHENKQTSTKLLQCNFCSTKVLHEESLRRHHMEKHPGLSLGKIDKPSVVCQYCGAEFVTTRGLEGHMRKHTGEKPYECQLCDVKFTNKSHLKYHEAKHNGVKFKCQSCPATFSSSVGLKYHESSVHTGERPFQCNFCDSNFIRSSDLKNHLKSHTGKTVFKNCDYCGLACTNRGQYYRHRETHMKEKPSS